MNIKYITKIEITVMHENEGDTEGLDDVLMNIVRSWDYPIHPSVYQAKPKKIDDEMIEEWIKKYLG